MAGEPDGFNKIIHAPTRLKLMSYLAPLDWAEFRLLREELSLSDSALSKQISILEEHRYIQIERVFVGKRPRSSVQLTPEGRKAFQDHVAALKALISNGI